MTDSIGIMDGAFFVSKKDLLDWIERDFKLTLTKVEDAHNGALYCQIIDAIFPDKVKMKKVNWNANNEYQIRNNYKILQQAFNDCKISKQIEVEKLMKGKPLDNLEFLQWLKKYYETNCNSYNYDAEERRGGAQLNNAQDTKKKSEDFKNNFGSTKNKENFVTKHKVAAINVSNVTATNFSKNSNEIKKQVGTINMKNDKNLLDNNSNVVETQNIENEDKLKQLTQELDKTKEDYLKIETKFLNLNEQYQTISNENNTLKFTLTEVSKEKSFYYSKLRDIEVLLSKPASYDKDQLIGFMKEILFNSKEMEVAFDENGKVDLKQLN